MEFNLQAYFSRIGLPNEPTEAKPTAARLRRIHKAHIMHVPFENLDVFAGAPIAVSDEGVYEKIVARRRGGYCFEMNACLAAGLRAAGFEVRGVLARVARPPMGFGGYSHRLNLITLPGGEMYVGDVGFGGECFTEPLALRLGDVQEANGLHYRVMEGTQVERVIQLEQGGDFVDMLGFNFAPCTDEDFAIGSYYTSTHPMSPFVTHIMCSLPFDGGRVTLFDRWLTRREGGRSETRQLEGDALPQTLEEVFSVPLTDVMLEKMERL